MVNSTKSEMYIGFVIGLLPIFKVTGCLLTTLLLFFSSFFDTGTYFYTVYRTDFVKFALKECIKFADNMLFIEFLLVAITLTYGKLKILDLFYGAREIAQVPYGLAERKWVYEMKNEGIYDKEYSKFREGLATHISKNSKLNIEQSRKLVDEGMSTYTKKYTSLKHDLNVKMRRTLPVWVYKDIYSLYTKLFRAEEIHNKSKIYEDYSCKYHEDIDKISNYVLHYSCNMR